MRMTIEEIVQELQMTPEKIHACRQYVLSDMLLDDSASDDDLKETFAFLHRVPFHLFVQCLQHFGFKLDDMRALKRSEKNIAIKLFHCACMTSGQTRVPSHRRKEFKQHFATRYIELGSPLAGAERQDI